MLFNNAYLSNALKYFTCINNCSHVKLIKESDGPENQIDHYAPMFVEKFSFVVVSTLTIPPAELLTDMFPVRIFKP